MPLYYILKKNKDVKHGNIVIYFPIIKLFIISVF